MFKLNSTDPVDMSHSLPISSIQCECKPLRQYPSMSNADRIASTAGLVKRY